MRRGGIVFWGMLLAAAPAWAETLSLQISSAEARTDAHLADPVVMVMLTAESSRAFGRFSLDQAKDLADRLTAGKATLDVQPVR